MSTDQVIMNGGTMLRRRPRAGRSAQARYETLRDGWRRRVLPRMRIVIWPLIAITLLGTRLPPPWAWATGCACGALLSMWLWVRDAVPRHIEQWQDGAEGERRTEKVLRPLEREGWLVEHDLAGLYGNIDHLVVSEAGVFVLDSKRWFGEVTVDGGTPTITPRDNPDAAWTPTGLARRMRGLGVRQKDAIERLTGVRTWVQSVVVIWAPFEQQVVECDRVVYVHGDCLAEWLKARPRHLPISTVDRIRQKVGTT